MDFNDYWQENKRFLVSVAAGLIVFLIGSMVVGNVYGSEVRSLRRALVTNTSRLKDDRYTVADRKSAEAENEALVAAVDQLTAALDFQVRPEFKLQAEAGSASNQYFGRVGSVSEALISLASRSRSRLPSDLGLDMLMTTREDIIVRHLEALDLIDRVVREGLDAGIDRVDSIQVRLDPALGSRAGLGKVERTSVRFKFSSDAPSIVRLLVLSQSDRYGASLPIESVRISGAGPKDDEVRVEITFLVVRLHGLPSQQEQI
jgi:hypothetical protein